MYVVFYIASIKEKIIKKNKEIIVTKISIFVFWGVKNYNLEGVHESFGGLAIFPFLVCVVVTWFFTL